MFGVEVKLASVGEIPRAATLPTNAQMSANTLNTRQGGVHALVRTKATNMLPCIGMSRQSRSSSRRLLARTGTTRLRCSPPLRLTLCSCANRLYLSSHLAAAGCCCCSASWDIGWCSRDGGGGRLWSPLLISSRRFCFTEFVGEKKGIFQCC